MLKIFYLSLLFCILNQISHSFPFFENDEKGLAAERSPLGDLFRHKAQFIDRIANGIQQTFQRGLSVFSNNANELRSSVNSVISATGQLLDDGIAAGKQYGITIFQGIMIVPKTMEELIMASKQDSSYLNPNEIENLSYVHGKPKYLFQYVNQEGKIIPITATVANKLVSNLNI